MRIMSDVFKSLILNNFTATAFHKKIAQKAGNHILCDLLRLSAPLKYFGNDVALLRHSCVIGPAMSLYQSYAPGYIMMFDERVNSDEFSTR